MSVATAITGLKSRVGESFDAVEAKGGTVPEDKTTHTLPAAIKSIETNAWAEDFFANDASRPYEVHSHADSIAQGAFFLVRTSSVGSAVNKNVGLTAAYFPDAKTIGSNAFRNCENLRVIDCPNVTAVNESDTYKYLYNTFKDCPNLERVNFASLEGSQTVNPGFQGTSDSPAHLTYLDMGSSLQGTWLYQMDADSSKVEWLRHVGSITPDWNASPFGSQKQLPNLKYLVIKRNGGTKPTGGYCLYDCPQLRVCCLQGSGQFYVYEGNAILHDAPALERCSLGGGFLGIENCKDASLVPEFLVNAPSLRFLYIDLTGSYSGGGYGQRADAPMRGFTRLGPKGADGKHHLELMVWHSLTNPDFPFQLDLTECFQETVVDRLLCSNSSDHSALAFFREHLPESVFPNIEEDTNLLGVSIYDDIWKYDYQFPKESEIE